MYVLLLINMTPVPALIAFAFRGFVSGADFLIIIQTQLECYCYHPEWLMQTPQKGLFGQCSNKIQNRAQSNIFNNMELKMY